MQRRLVEQISLVAGSLPVFLPVPEAAGHGTLDAGWKGDALPMGAFFWKIIATSVTLGCGGSGGMVTPIFLSERLRAIFLPNSSTRTIDT